MYIYCIFNTMYSSNINEWVNEWLFFNAKWEIVQLYFIENKLHFDEMMMIIIMSTLY